MDKKHSGLGIASFIVSLALSVLTFAIIVGAGVMEATTPGGLADDSPVAIILGISIMASLFFCLVPLGLGVAGLIQRDRKKVFAILGTLFSLATVGGTIALVILGLSMD